MVLKLCRPATSAGDGYPAAPARARLARRRSGHQWFCHWSSQMSRTCGSTSRANRSMFFSVSSWGMEPMCRSTIRLPTRSFLIASVSWSRTEAGLPAMTSWFSTKSLKRHSGSWAVTSWMARVAPDLRLLTRLR